MPIAYRIQTENGHLKYVLEQHYRLKEYDYIFSVISDITGKKEREITQKLISESLDKLGVSLEVYDLGKQAAVYTNDITRNFFGISKKISDEDLLEYWLNNVVHPKDRKEQKEIISSMIKDEKVPSFKTYKILHSRKGIRNIKATFSDPIEFLDKKYISSLSMDVTKPKKKKDKK